MIMTGCEFRSGDGRLRGEYKSVAEYKLLTVAFSSAERARFLSSQRTSEPANLINRQ
jgi:hypothetical protein